MCLVSARVQWDSQVKGVESILRGTPAKCEAGLATVALLQLQEGTAVEFGLIGGDVSRGFCLKCHSRHPDHSTESQH